jgi:hypothetical protein
MSDTPLISTRWPHFFQHGKKKKKKNNNYLATVEASLLGIAQISAYLVKTSVIQRT